MYKKFVVSLLLVIGSCVGFAQTNWILPRVAATKFKPVNYSITKYGAVPDGHQLNTRSIQNAIDDCSKKGGGTVLVPSGLWLTGPIVLKSNVNLNLSVGATLLFTKDKTQYPLVKANWEGYDQMRNQSPISAEGATNIAITGKGIIDGNGDGWRMVKKDKLTESQWRKLVASGGVVSKDGRLWMPSEGFAKGQDMKDPGRITPDRDEAHYRSIKDFLRPNLLVLTKCDKILLEGVTFQNSPAWNLHPLMSSNITVRNIQVKNPWYAQNGDGIDLESCRNVLIENSVFDVGDDGLCIKSGRDADGRARAMPTRDVIIRGCTVYASHGGFVVGSEMSGGAKNIYVSNCTFVGSDIGLRFKTTRGRGGIVENIFIKDIYMKDIPGDAVLFDMYYMGNDPVPMEGEKRELPKVQMLPVDETTPQFRNINISNVYCNGAKKAIFIRGLPEMHVKNIKIENSVFQSDIGVDIQEASGITLNNVKVFSKNTKPVIDIINSDNIFINKFDYAKETDLLIRVAGDRTKAVTLQQTNYSNTKVKAKAELGANEKSVQIK
ncbi:glycoside hydrolase family 28 protein [Niabella yanshanensis]|uniref:Glycoside hydrolase family 28 protein n=1 Tax=Niabella yanshanensis TaxID=577386 RepID=A0ABZ0WAN0_9BACT|nr:glycoside hydrolase family 28 protein [Niabella yanshanensis]WQD40353.1 glycoside hydrolase family 28 protein [Niabella yanshanensis]